LRNISQLPYFAFVGADQARSATTKVEILRTAERLFALEGIDAVSTRRVAEEAGQRNNSALQYHFGDRATLLKTIVAARMVGINQRRRALLDALERDVGTIELADLVAVLVIPFVDQLLDVEGGVYYVRIAAQIFAKGEAEQVLGPERPWNEAFYAAIQRMRAFLAHLPRAVQDRRFRLLAGHLVQATAAAEMSLRGLPTRARAARVRTLADELVDYTTGALAAPRHAARSLRAPARR
jgi:AcrR family transcriptional regulator